MNDQYRGPSQSEMDFWGKLPCDSMGSVRVLFHCWTRPWTSAMRRAISMEETAQDVKPTCSSKETKCAVRNRNHP